MYRCLLGLVAAALLVAGCNNSKPETVVTNIPKRASTWVGIGPGGAVPLNGDNTKITFARTKAGAKHSGGFNKLTGKIPVSRMGPGQTPAMDERGIISAFDVDIEADSLFTDNDELTQQLKGDDFLKVRQHSTISFTSSKVRTPGSSEEEMEITGDLTIAGVKKPITCKVKASKERGFYLTGSFKLSLKDFGLAQKPVKIDDEVNVTITVGADPNAKTE